MNKNKNIITNILLIALIFGCAGYYYNTMPTEVSYNSFIGDVKNDNITSIEVQEDSKTIVYADRQNNKKSTVITVDLQPFIDNLVQSDAEITMLSPPKPMTTMTYVIISIVCVLIFVMLLKSGSVMSNFTKSRAILIDPKKIGVSLKDVACCPEDMLEITEVIEFLTNADKYIKAKAKLPTGILLYGPPGTGKTHIAKAIAAEANVPFYHVSGSDFDELFVGTGSGRMRDMFEEAKKKSPCIVFIDEIDSVGKKRSNAMSSSPSADQTLNQLLVQMDGFNTDDKVVIIGATNRMDVLDPALLRPGRFDRTIAINLPDLASRKKILEIYLKNKKLADDINVDIIAKGTAGFSGAKLASLANEAAVFAARQDKEVINQNDLEKAKDKVLMGVESPKNMSEEEIRITAYHESGHAIVGHLMPEHDTVYKISIIPRSNALGVTMFVSSEEAYSRSKTKVIGDICTLLAGRAAEEILLGSEYVTTGASNDIERATELATSMVTHWGFGIHLRHQHSAISDDKKSKIDEEIDKILEECYTSAMNILRDSIDKLHSLAEQLIEHETLTETQIKQILE